MPDVFILPDRAPITIVYLSVHLEFKDHSDSKYRRHPYLPEIRWVAKLGFIRRELFRELNEIPDNNRPWSNPECVASRTRSVIDFLAWNSEGHLAWGGGGPAHGICAGAMDVKVSPYF